MAIQPGKRDVYIDLVNMKGEILWLMKKRFPIAMVLGTAAQLALALGMIWYAQGGLKPAAMEDKDAEAYFLELLDGRLPSGVQRGFEAGSIVENMGARKHSEWETTLLKDDGCIMAAIPSKTSVSVREELEMDHLPRR